MRNAGRSAASFSTVVSGRGMLVALQVAGRDELVVEAAGLRCRGMPSLRLEREGVLVLPAHTPALGDVLTGAAHRLERESPLELRVRKPPTERRVVQGAVAAWKRPIRLRGDERRARHRLDAAGDEQIAVTGDHGVARTDDGGEAGCAETVDGHARDGLGKAGEEDGHARDVAVVLACLVRAAEPDVLDLLGGNACTVDGRADGDRRQVVGADCGEPAAVAADRRPDGGEDHGLRHGTNSAATPVPARRSSSATAARPESPMSSVRSFTYIATN